MNLRFVSIFLITFFLSAIATAEDVLDHRSYSLELTQSNNAKVPKILETISFIGGQMDSEHFGKEGFRKANYNAVLSGTITFTVSMQNRKEGLIDWTGLVRGRNIEGTAVVTETIENKDKQEETVTTEYQFTGSQK